MIEVFVDWLGGLILLGFALSVLIGAWVIPGAVIALAIGLFSKPRATPHREGE